VSSFDIAELVRGAMAQRKKKAPDKSSIIDNLIEEALFEFNSLTDDAENPNKSAPKAQAAKPTESLGFEDIGKWADEVQPAHTGRISDAESEVRASISRATAEIGIGNLEALEDDDSPPNRPQTPPTPAVGSGSIARVEDARVPSARPAPPPAKSGGMSPLLYIVVLVVVAGGVAGAWFAGIIPH
jgi:hypothetical protein